MTNEFQQLRLLAAQERAIALVDPDPLKRSHHEEFADRYLAQARSLELALKAGSINERLGRLQDAAEWIAQAGRLLFQSVSRRTGAAT
jgi:hypothetical protein